jgi:hypothetical protein
MTNDTLATREHPKHSPAAATAVDAVEIHLTKGYYALVDRADFELIGGLKWTATEAHNRKSGQVERVYAIRQFLFPDGSKRNVLLHRYLMGDPPEDIDHRSGDTLDNRRSNLRTSTRSENNANARKRHGCSSARKGVYFHRQMGCWCAQIAKDGKSKHLGLFATEEAASGAYAASARQLYGEFARP